MKIKGIKIRKLYGFMDKDIEFKEKISILVGINGSGKTSVLNMINWLLKPNIGELCRIEFESIMLNFYFKGDEYSLLCIQNKVEITFDVENLTKNKKFNQIQATFKIHPKKLTKDEYLKNSISDAYDNLGPEPHEVETWDFLFNDLSKPIIIGLDRDLYTEEGEDIRYQADFISNDKKASLRKEQFSNQSPLAKVNKLLSKEHNIYRNNVLRLYSSLNEKIMLSAFDKIFTKDNISSLLKQPKPSIGTIDILKEQVNKFLTENQVMSGKANRKSFDKSISKVNTYFDTLKEILK